ncbi:MAG: hypothetical protein BEN19_07460 [Epulopiscium sp. Nuni2H_MBin003]|nr:MAG: hypothetical protein BEN19_07460 [Epulopiscium sp. Nuni2H_MBin003]
MIIKTLMENSPSQNKILVNEHGLSFYIEHGENKILFDCGASIDTYENANKMNIAIDEITHVVLSHSHYDHAYGYVTFMDKGLKAPLYVGEKFWEEKYAKVEEKYIYLGCGFSKKVVEKHGIIIKNCIDIIDLGNRSYIVGDFERRYASEKIPQRFVKQCEGKMIVDDFADEVALVVEHEKGLVIIVGCSHPGIINILKSISRRFNKSIYAVFGGTHLVEADAQRIDSTMQDMHSLGVQHVGFNHCTGERAFKENLSGIKVCSLNVGECCII